MQGWVRLAQRRQKDGTHQMGQRGQILAGRVLSSEHMLPQRIHHIEESVCILCGFGMHQRVEKAVGHRRVLQRGVDLTAEDAFVDGVGSFEQGAQGLQGQARLGFERGALQVFGDQTGRQNAERARHPLRQRHPLTRANGAQGSSVATKAACRIVKQLRRRFGLLVPQRCGKKNNRRARRAATPGLTG